MENQTGIDKVTAALFEASKFFKPLQKSASNSHFKNSYSTLDDIIAATEQALRDNDLLLVDTTELMFLSNGEVMHIIKTALIHVPSGQQLVSATPIKAKTPQEMGSSQTYAKRYHRSCLLNMSSGDADDDGNLSSGITSSAKSAIAKAPLKPVSTTVPSSTLPATSIKSKGSATSKLFGGKFKKPQAEPELEGSIEAPDDTDY